MREIVCVCMSSSVNFQFARLVQDEHADLGKGARGVEETDDGLVLVRVWVGEVDGINIDSPVERLCSQPVLVVRVEDGMALQIKTHHLQTFTMK